MSAAATPGSTIAAQPLRPRLSLERKAVLWTLALVAASTLCCVWWMDARTRAAMRAEHGRQAEMVGELAAGALSGHTDSPGELVGVVDRFSVGPRLAFVLVLGADGKILRLRVDDNTAWAHLERHCQGLPQNVLSRLREPIELEDDGSLVAWVAPVWLPRVDGESSEQLAVDEPIAAQAAALTRPAPNHKHSDADTKHLEGYVVTGLRDPSLSVTLARLRAAHLAAAGVMSIVSLAFAIGAVHRWGQRLSRLVSAAATLAAGRDPAPLAVESRDEIGLLSRQFNEMSGSLASARQQLRHANEVLEEKVRHRTEELEHVNRLLEAEVRDKNEFLRAVSHDLQAPIRNIAGMTSMLMTKHKGELNDDAQRKLERIGANARAQADLLNDLLDLSRIRNRNVRGERIDLNALLSQLREGLSFDLERGRITMELAGDLPVINAERTRIRQVFQNLLDNAIKYMLDAKERRVRVTCVSRGPAWEFAIADTGRGIARQDMPGLFQVFRRGVHSGTHRVPGRGVGLTSVKTIVEKYGGRVWAESTLGKGSTFYFTLDKARVAESRGAGRVTEAKA